MLEFIWENAEKIGALSTAIAVVLTVFGVGFAAGQVFTSRASHREMTAQDTWRNYEILSFQNVRFANPEPGSLDLVAETFDGSRELFHQYKWYVSIMLLACEEVLTAFRGRQDWTASVRTQFERHRELLKSSLFTESGWAQLADRRVLVLIATL